MTVNGVLQSEAIAELAAALSKAQGQMENATMNKVNPHFRSRYADLASVLDAVRGPLSANGLAVTQVMELRDAGMVLRTVLMHASGQWLATEYPLPLIAKPHEMGSALTYARRYSLAALVCNSADEDDDANAAQSSKPDKQIGSTTMSPEQVEQLQTLIVQTGTDISRFCKHFNIASKKIEDMPPQDFDRAAGMLKSKLVIKVQPEAAA